MIDLNDEIKKLQAENEAWSKEFKECMSYQNAGMAFEKAGKYEDAALKYEKAIDFGTSSKRLRSGNYFHSVERLAIVYRRLKRYDDEIRVINTALVLDISENDRSKLLLRLHKANLLKSKL